MRLWSLNPKYLDCKGLVACWREGLLAQKVLKGETKGYKNHPQLDRFINTCPNKDWSLIFISKYLDWIHIESYARNYNFDENKIHFKSDQIKHIPQLKVTKGQLEYEWRHLENKLCDRQSQYQFDRNCKYTNYGKNIEPHPLFKVIKGDIESWEKIK